MIRFTFSMFLAIRMSRCLRTSSHVLPEKQKIRVIDDEKKTTYQKMHYSLTWPDLHQIYYQLVVSFWCCDQCMASAMHFDQTAVSCEFFSVSFHALDKT